ncbi:MAG TPA: type II secretion system F family protein [Abditibacteriaceae bacterium]|jgi:type IV pilus assembly protein PilC
MSNEIQQFTRDFAARVDGGESIVSALASLANAENNAVLHHALNDVNRDVQSGATLSAALRAHPALWPESYCQHIREGEASDLRAALHSLAQ